MEDTTKISKSLKSVQKSLISDKSLFIDFMGDSPTVRVLDYLLTERGLDFSITDIAKNAGIGRTTLYRMWDNIIKNKIIIPTRIIGKAKLYKLNRNSFVIKRLIEIDDRLILEDLKKRSKEQNISRKELNSLRKTAKVAEKKNLYGSKKNLSKN